MNTLVSVASVASASAVPVPTIAHDPIFAAIETHRAAVNADNQAAEFVDEAEAKAGRVSGQQRPARLVQFYNYLTCGTELDEHRTRLLEQPGANRRQIEREYKSARARELDLIAAGWKWDKRNGISPLRYQCCAAVLERRKAEQRLVGTEPTTLAGAVALLVYVRVAELELFLEPLPKEWRFAALKTLEDALRSMMYRPSLPLGARSPKSEERLFAIEHLLSKNLAQRKITGRLHDKAETAFYAWQRCNPKPKAPDPKFPDLCLDLKALAAKYGDHARLEDLHLQIIKAPIYNEGLVAEHARAMKKWEALERAERGKLLERETAWNKMLDRATALSAEAAAIRATTIQGLACKARMIEMDQNEDLEASIVDDLLALSKMARLAQEKQEAPPVKACLARA